MTPQETLKQLIDEQAVEHTLKRSSSARDAIQALQTLLHQLGFAAELKWSQYGADGDYGSGTAAAVQAFATRNGLPSDGERVSPTLAAQLLTRYNSLDEMRQLYSDVQENRVEQSYYRNSSQTIAVVTLQTLLHELGFDTELNWAKYGADGRYGKSTVKAVKAFAAQVGIVSDGTTLSLALARLIIAQLEPFYGSAWANVEGITATTVEALNIQTVFSGGKQRVQVSDGTMRGEFTKFKRGVYTYGNQKALTFLNAHQHALRSLGLTDSAITVMVSVAENEGNLDAVNTWDNAFLSFGMFQWTAGTGDGKGELPALLQKIKTIYRQEFDKYYGRFGLDVVGTSETDGYFSLNGKRLDTAAGKEQLRTPAWAFSFWCAGQAEKIQEIEVHHALSRLKTFYNTDRYQVGAHRVSDLITSEYGVALILDNHVNRPGYVNGCLKKALSQTGLGDPKQWGTAEERRLIAAYLKIRETYQAGKVPPMTDAAKRAGVTKRYLDNGTISDVRGSFANPFV